MAYDRPNATMFRTARTTQRRSGGPAHAQGRFPANLIHDGSQEVLDLFPETKGDKSPELASSKAASASNNDSDEGLEGFQDD